MVILNLDCIKKKNCVIVTQILIKRFRWKRCEAERSCFAEQKVCNFLGYWKVEKNWNCPVQLSRKQLYFADLYQTRHLHFQNRSVQFQIAALFSSILFLFMKCCEIWQHCCRKTRCGFVFTLFVLSIYLLWSSKIFSLENAFNFENVK